jgi:DNA-binding HxlR family transcriptional regulator
MFAKHKLLVLCDTLEVIQGKWRLPIIISLLHGNKRFGEIQKDIADISPKMLSQELKALETSKIIRRTLYDSMPVKVEYSVTDLGKTMNKMLDEILNCGVHFRKENVSR